MVWVKMSDDALDDPRLDGVPAEAVLSYLRALSRSNRWALGGRVPAASAPPEAVRVWLDAGLAEQAGPDHLQLVWLLEDQPTAEEIAEQRAKWRRDKERRDHHAKNDHRLCNHCGSAG